MKKWDLWKRSYQVLLTTDSAAYFTTEESYIWYLVNTGDLKIKLTRKRSNQYKGRQLPFKILNQEQFFPFLLPSLTILFLILELFKYLCLFSSSFALLCHEKIILSFTYLRPLQSRLTQPPNNCQICYASNISFSLE